MYPGVLQQVGHITITAPSADEARRRLAAIDEGAAAALASTSGVRALLTRQPRATHPSNLGLRCMQAMQELQRAYLRDEQVLLTCFPLKFDLHVEAGRGEEGGGNRRPRVGIITGSGLV